MDHIDIVTEKTQNNTIITGTIEIKFAKLIVFIMYK